MDLMITSWFPFRNNDTRTEEQKTENRKDRKSETWETGEDATKPATETTKYKYLKERALLRRILPAFVPSLRRNKHAFVVIAGYLTVLQKTRTRKEGHCES